MAWAKPQEQAVCAEATGHVRMFAHTHTSAAEKIYGKHVPAQHQRSAACAEPSLSAHSCTPGLQLCLAQTRLREYW